MIKLIVAKVKLYQNSILKITQYMYLPEIGIIFTCLSCMYATGFKIKKIIKRKFYCFMNRLNENQASILYNKLTTK